MKLHIVPARTGIQWVKQGVQTFWRQPMALAALFFLTMAAMSIASLVPVIGPALALALLPTSSLVMMVGAAEAFHNRMPTPTLLLVAFRTGRERLRAMATLGALYALGFGLLMGLSTLIDGGTFASVYLGQTPMTQEMALDSGFQSAMWITLALYLPLSLLFWHAPALVHWHGVPPVKAMFFSIVACFRNFGAFLMYGLGWMGMFMAAGVALALVTALLSSVIGAAAGALMVAAAMMLAAMFFCSVVFTFRDCFSAPDGNAELQEDHTPPASSLDQRRDGDGNSEGNDTGSDHNAQP